ncbi:MAG: shikimate kinase [Planctomycetia bacterium]|nr:shikimate kinase [Planctomycetia bacterium]
MPLVTLIGYRGTGKSTVAAELSRLLGRPWRDADSVLEERIGGSIAGLVRERGEDVFREHESAVLEELLGFEGVLATGGGAVLRQSNRRSLRIRGRPIVWLTASADVIRGRLGADPLTAARRPALAGSDPLAEVDAALVVREPFYRECADVSFDTGSIPVDDVARRIAAWLETGWPAVRGAPS